ncbi:MAG: hypothetical protein ACI379_03785 [Nocardioides sp.]|uniref:hypothetical protein n=1 Tax=Nocardioides sp. TaxID=35761 RepID=UPI003F119163
MKRDTPILVHPGKPSARSLRLLAAMGAVVLLVTACGGGGGEGNAEKSAESTPSATEDAETFTIANREQFLASGPDCEALSTWYEHNPRDEDEQTVRRHLEECGELPEAFADNGKLLLKLRSEIFESTEVEGSDTRSNLHKAMAAETCFNAQNGDLSPYDVALDVDNGGGVATDTTAVLDLAAGVCPEYADDLTVFASDDLMASVEALEAFVSKTWPDALAGSGELVGMAHLVCKDGPDQIEIEATNMVLEMGLAGGAADSFRSYVEKNLCR